ncbi:serine hydrolase domain-containing protein [Paenibacillus apis]|uniref:6-aminohexanoate-dimer hydrolase n=1 Tax=Paenibacillus apis TaxID=1792174 RepID=A0A919Y830_9BACL|nr:serine hydrolase [Paenibacillus apis]GIO44070.1 6-aminohexanoate-dimer hydrolase [Paenibacillus apis]
MNFTTPTAPALHAADRTIRAQYPGIRCFLLAQHGQMRHEQYFQQSHPAVLHDLRSATKSVLSLLLGIAQYQELLPELDKPVWDDVKEYAPSRPDSYWPEMTLRQLLSMTGGLYWETGPKLGERFIHRLHRSKNWTGFVLRLPVIPEQRGHFQYCSAYSHLLACLLSKWSGTPVRDYADRYLFSPLEIKDYHWETAPDGGACGHVGLYMKAIDMMKLGQLCLAGGTFRGNRLLQEEWLHESMTPRGEAFSEYGQYGYHWWTSEFHGLRYAYAHGHGGQQIYVLPELEAVAVFASACNVKRCKNPKRLMEEQILPVLLADRGTGSE